MQVHVTGRVAGYSQLWIGQSAHTSHPTPLIPRFNPPNPCILPQMAPNNRSRSNSTAHQQQALRTNSPNVNRTNFRNQQHQNQNQQQQQQQQYVHHQPTRPPTSMTPSGTPQRAIQAVQQMADMGMSPGSRYSQNLKVLRRHDPSIVSIFYQFSHVVVYRYDEQKWVRGGCEGTMFLFER